MSEPRYAFDNSPWGGAHVRVLTLDEMPPYFPIGQAVRENIIRGARGKIWKYEWYRKQRVTIRFESVGSAILATMGSIVGEGLSFRWYEDVLIPDSATGTMVYIGEEFRFTPIDPTHFDFSFEMEALE